MRRLIACGLTVLALALFLAAPGAAAKYDNKDLLGSWDGDVMAMMKASGMMEQMPTGFDMSQMLAGLAIVLTFDKDGTITFYHKGFDGEETETDHYEVVGTEDNVLTLQNVDEDGTKQTVVVTFSDKDNMTLEIDEEGAMPMVFKRAAKKEKAAAAAK